MITAESILKTREQLMQPPPPLVEIKTEPIPLEPRKRKSKHMREQEARDNREAHAFAKRAARR